MILLILLISFVGGCTSHIFTKERDSSSLEYMQEYRDLYDGKEIEDIRKEVEVSDGEYLVLTDYEADEKFEEYCRSYIDDCMEIPENMKSYFNEEKFIQDVRDQDGRGNSLASYDSEENEIKDPDSDEWFYIYRTN